MARVLGRIRLSRSTDESTSEARQRKLITDYCENNDHELVGIAVDLDVSGSVSPFETPEFGKWLRDPSGFDHIVSWKLDRLGRGLFDMTRLFSWCEENKKTLACTADNIDLSTGVGKLVATLLAGIADMELANIRARNKASADYLLKSGRYSGGVVPWGYKVEEAPSGGWYFAVDHEVAPVIREVFRRVVARQSVNSIANWLTDSGVKPPRGGEVWSTNSLTRMLRGRLVLGQVERKDANGHVKVVIDESTGLPLQRCEGIISESLWQQAQTVLDDMTRRKVNANDKGMLLGVLTCGECFSAMYLHVMAKKDRKQVYRYWRCSGKAKRHNGCSNRGVPAADVESYVSERFLAVLGDVERTEEVFVPATGSGEELEQVENAISRLKAESDAGLIDDTAEYINRLRSLTARRNELQSIESLPARWEARGTGETYRQAWERMTGIERRELLIDCAVSATADLNVDEPYNVIIPLNVIQGARKGRVVTFRRKAV
jgi:site-specific DNA recombinase